MTSNAELDGLLDTTLDDLSDLPSFSAWVAGTYAATIVEAGMKKIAEHPSFVIKFKYKNTLELAKEDDVPPKEGDEMEVAFMLDNEIGQGKLKELVKGVSEALGCTSLRAFKDAAKGADVILVTSRRYDDKKDRWYPDLKTLALA